MNQPVNSTAPQTVNILNERGEPMTYAQAEDMAIKMALGTYQPLAESTYAAEYASHQADVFEPAGISLEQYIRTRKAESEGAPGTPADVRQEYAAHRDVYQAAGITEAAYIQARESGID